MITDAHRDDVHVVLVHGTFAPKAPWTNHSSEICQSISRQLSDFNVKFHTPQWSGANSHSDRIRAGKELAEYTEKLAMERPGSYFLVGHSHGGTVIAHALRQSQELSKIVSGSVFLSTPFIQVRRKDYHQQLLTLISTLLAMCIYLPAVFLLGYTATILNIPDPIRNIVWIAEAWLVVTIHDYVINGETFSDALRRLRSNIPVATFLLTAAIVEPMLEGIRQFLNWLPIAEFILKWGITLLAAMGLAVFTLDRWGHFTPPTRKKEGRIELGVGRIEEQFAIRNIAHDNALFIRGNNDEANAGLVWIQVAHRIWGFFIALPVHLFHMLDTRWWGKKWKKRGRLTRALIIAATVIALGPAMLGMTAAAILAILSMSGLAFGVDVDGTLSPIIRSLLDKLPKYSIEFANALQFAWILFFPLLLASVAFGLTGLFLLTRAFGGWFLVSAAFLEMSIEPVPPGRWSLTQLLVPNSKHDWEALTLGELSHSIYLNPEAQEAVAAWIRSKCLSSRIIHVA